MACLRFLAALALVACARASPVARLDVMTLPEIERQAATVPDLTAAPLLAASASPSSAPSVSSAPAPSLSGAPVPSAVPFSIPTTVPSTTATATAVPSTTATAGPSSSATGTPEPSTTATTGPSSSATSTPEPSTTATAAASSTPSSSMEVSPSMSTVPTPTAEISPSVSPVPSESVTPSASSVPSQSASSEPSQSAAATIFIPTKTPSFDTLTEPVTVPSPEALPLLVPETPTPNADSGAGTLGLPNAPTNTSATSAVCFPAHALVTLRSGMKRMDSLQVGDEVAVGGGKYSPVFMFTHKLSDVEHDFVRLSIAGGRQIMLTEGHYMYLSGSLRAARTARVGDVVELGDATEALVVGVSTVRARGLYNPQTTHGDIVVDGVCASTYTTAVQPGFAQAALAPLRAVFGRLAFSTRVLHAGADSLVQWVPQGASRL